ncbi:hypothetical protein AMS68_001127 [Peltaster fructicola]|uniref:Protein kinase domain-containing protein n=1 Tax=Peltaster fructicola TaxID=286661 RepID=A0A6H0XM86_9PEZI|nr:hypothetical protein AMS68_001127 [Peltaster fructicola]
MSTHIIDDEYRSNTPASPSLLGRSTNSDGTTETANRTRSAVKRVLPARKISPKSPFRRALSDNANQANLSPRLTRRSSSDNEQENMDCGEDTNKRSTELRHEDAMKFDFAKPRDLFLQPVLKEHAPPKSSPLKRSDGLMDLEAASSLSPRAKRRSIHGTCFGSDFNIFDQGYDGTFSSGPSDDMPRRVQADHSMPPPSTSSPHRRQVNLRRSTLQQRNGPSRSRAFGDVFNEETASSPATTRARSRISLDGALLMHSSDHESPFRRNSTDGPPVRLQPPALGQRQHHSAPKPHPLSVALSPSSSSSSMAEDPLPTHVAPMFQPVQHAPHLRSTFSRSLPIGSLRPSPPAGEGSFATPAGFKMTKPFPQAFMSTGLISKRNRNIESPSSFAAGPMPDTPSKKAHSHIVPTHGIGHFNVSVSHEAGSPSTPFHCRVSDYSPETYRSGNIFGVAPPDLGRRNSFLSVHEDEQGQSPSRGADQTSADDLPPTPTKSAHSGPRPQSKGKSNSLRSSLFGRRGSIGPDTFAAPSAESVSPEKSSTPTESIDIQVSPKGRSPHTPSGSFVAPDASKLSISAERNPSLFPSNSFPPATPTGPRDQPFKKSMGQSFASSGYFANDVDTSLTSRFSSVVTHGLGEFSQVYKVEGSLQPFASPSAASHTVWAVKKSRKPYLGNKDRQRKMQEVHILQQLRGSEHVVEYVDSWESKNHLYIQTQFCENGNLKDFLTQTGFKGRLDDFRIWKILLELSQGIKAIHDSGIIHLDIKPANVFIDWEGVLKVGDFGLASTWPAPKGIDGEGDREYIGPEVLSGRFDKPADIFSLGMVMLEIAGNIVLPDNGKSWQRLRAGDMSDLPSLTWSSDSSLERDESGEPIDMLARSHEQPSFLSQPADDDLSFLRNPAPMSQRSQELVEPPNFMVDARDPEALDKVVQWMICPDPDRRPVIAELLAAGGVQWVERRRRAGATVYEGNWGPADDILEHGDDVEMVDI